ncbi:hypothetical protein J7E99_40010, partial [Streptomyces sp. ISL-44]
MTVSDATGVSRRAGELFRSGGDRILDDVGRRRIQYHLLRLTLVGLTRDDVEDLRELARLAFEDADVTGQAAKIKERAGASTLAVAIADIVEQARAAGPQGSRAQVMMGAVLGAYAMVGGTVAESDLPFESLPAAAVVAAVGGAL